MGYYDRALICKNGHLINSGAEDNPTSNSAFCGKCGEPVVDKCENCGEPIRGNEYDDQQDGCDMFGPLNRGFWGMPRHCHACGKPYPWTERKVEALSEIVDVLDGLSQEEREKLKNSIPDIVADTPKSDPAVFRFKRAAAKVGQTGAKMLMEVLTNVATEAVKKALGI